MVWHHDVARWFSLDGCDLRLSPWMLVPRLTALEWLLVDQLISQDPVD